MYVSIVWLGNKKGAINFFTIKDHWFFLVILKTKFIYKLYFFKYFLFQKSIWLSLSIYFD